MAGKKRGQSPESKKPVGPLRDEKGRILPGQSGNPGGRPKVYAEAKAYAGKHALRMLKLLVSLADDEENEPRLRRDCALDVVAYAIGKPTQAVEVSDPDGKPAEFIIRYAPAYLTKPQEPEQEGTQCLTIESETETAE